MSVLLALLFAIDLTPVAAESIWFRPAHAKVADDGFWLAVNTTLVHWDWQGKLHCTIEENHQILDFYHEPELTIITRRVRSEDGVAFPTEIHREDQTVSAPDVYLQNLMRIEGEWFAITDESIQAMDQWTYPALIQRFDLDLAEPKPIQSKESFGKPSALQVQHRLNWKRFWLVSQADALHLVNELEPIVYHYTADERQVEQKQGYRSASVPQNTLLELDRFTRIPQNPFRLTDYVDKKVVDRDTSFHWFRKWSLSWSRIMGFHRIEDGYLIAYSLPCEGDPQDCYPYNLAIQPLDQSFQPIGQARQAQGLWLGVAKGKGFVMTPALIDGQLHCRIQSFSF